MGEEDEVCELIRSVITSQKGGVLLKDLNRDYISLAGDPIPYRKLGFNSIEDLVKKIPEINTKVNHDGQILYTSTGKNCEHLVHLISNQKGSKNASSKNKSNHVKYMCPQRNGYSSDHQSRKLVPRNSKSNADCGLKESEYPESLTKKHNYVPKNAGVKMRFMEAFSSEKNTRDLRQRIMENNGKFSLGKIQNNSFNFVEEITPFNNSKPVSMNTRYDNFQSIDKSSRVGVNPPQCTRSPKCIHRNYDDKLTDRLHESQGSPRTRLRENRRLTVNSHLNFSHLDNKGLNHKGILRHSDNIPDKYIKNRNSPKLRVRHSSNEVEHYGREPFDEYYNRCSWKDEGILDWHSEDRNSSYTDRKIDLVTGSLRVTIKNL